MKKLAHKCGVCLGEYVLVDTKAHQHLQLPRHGWQVVDMHGHGQEGAHHDGACPGWEKPFPHLGISPEGAQWRLDQLILQHKQLEDSIARVLAKPATIPYRFEYQVYERARYKRVQKVERFTVAIGEAERMVDIAGYGPVRVPSYEQCQKRLLDYLELDLRSTKTAMGRYQEVIEGWTPSAPYLIEVRTVIVHAGVPWLRHVHEVQAGTRKPEDVKQVAKCRPYGSRVTGALTTNPDEVNCKRCQKALGQTSENNSIPGTRHIRPV